MKIRNVKIENFRSIKELQFEFQDLMILIGENNAGKTNIFKALDLFFSTSVRGMDDECFCNKDLDKDITITVTFDRLNQSETERIGKYLIDGRLTVQKTFFYDPSTGKIDARYSGMVREPKAGYLKLSNFDQFKHELTKIVRENSLPNYFKTSKGTVTQESYKTGVERYIDENKDTIEWDDPVFLETQFLGWKPVAVSKFTDFLYVPAVKEVSDESKYASSNLFGRLIDAMLTRIPERDEKLRELRDLFKRAGRLLNRPLEGEDDARPGPIIELERKLLTLLKESMPSTSDVRITIEIPKVEDVFRSSTRIIVDDGIPTSVDSKGHGLQRMLLFTLFRMYADLLRATGGETVDHRSLIFAIEDPEIYLHPQAQRKMFEVLKTISETDQVVICTHSPFFVDMNYYTSFGIVSKPDTTLGTQIFQRVKEIFPPEEREAFKLINEFNPERNEVFFAKKVLLVEGETEKVAFPLIATKLDRDFDAEGISVVECGGKYNITLLMKILNTFRIPYLVTHDQDPIPTKKMKREEEINARKIFQLNQRIADELDPTIGTIITLNPDFDGVIGLSKRKAEAPGKTFAIFKKFREMSIAEIPQPLITIVEKL